ncbi:NUDIX hydrolase [Litoribacter alkaliphilus]|uniref:NUDIX hydrolase n=1 Tax=Litoribacter ruber TaxID=702568 RepID=A0AAP2CHQ7_9BACT|nr:NUDIX domain-containing protein [Litoribacter alkaliphilus]MBS9522780.1 NUDIX hydrolase [Litoribacter alkaliphilus]
MKYSNQERMLVAVDSIIIGFDGNEYKILLIQRGFAPEKEKWSLMGGFVQKNESLDDAASRILDQLTGLKNVYLEQLHSFGKPNRDPIERVIAVTYMALIDIQQYEQQINNDFHARWFPINQLPKLIFDHEEMIDMALMKLRYKATLHPVLFELLPDKFTIPQLITMYEGLFATEIDKRNFSRKILSSDLLIKENEKDKSSSKRGAFYFRLNRETYKKNFQRIHNFLPKN